MLRMRRTTKYVARNTPSASVIVRSLQSREKPCVFRQGPARRAQCSQEAGACQKLHDALRCRSAGAVLLGNFLRAFADPERTSPCLGERVSGSWRRIFAWARAGGGPGRGVPAWARACGGPDEA